MSVASAPQSTQAGGGAPGGKRRVRVVRWVVPLAHCPVRPVRLRCCLRRFDIQVGQCGPAVAGRMRVQWGPVQGWEARAIGTIP